MSSGQGGDIGANSKVGTIPVAHTVKSVETFKELSHRLDQIVGVPFSELAGHYGKEWKGSATQNKGWGGNLVDFLVGGDAGNAPVADISALGIEVKTIPIGFGARVLQPTKVTALNYGEVARSDWWESSAFHKLRAVLFVPIVKHDPSEPNGWFIRRPFLWLPSETVLRQFKADYESVRKLIATRDFDGISSAKPPKGQGVYLHPKPAAANSAVRRSFHIEGEEFRLMPRAWMLRESFTQPIVKENLRVDLRLAATG
jgi:DNA mismatch repair protein MutH